MQSLIFQRMIFHRNYAIFKDNKRFIFKPTTSDEMENSIILEPVRPKRLALLGAYTDSSSIEAIANHNDGTFYYYYKNGFRSFISQMRKKPSYFLWFITVGDKGVKTTKGSEGYVTHIAICNKCKREEDMFAIDLHKLIRLEENQKLQYLNSFFQKYEGRDIVKQARDIVYIKQLDLSPLGTLKQVWPSKAIISPDEFLNIE